MDAVRAGVSDAGATANALDIMLDAKPPIAGRLSKIDTADFKLNKIGSCWDVTEVEKEPANKYEPFARIHHLAAPAV